MKRVALFLGEAVPLLIMLALIPLVADDALLFGVYLGVIVVSITMRRRRYDVLAFVLGAIIMTFAELLFLTTGVETFMRDSFLGVMPLWLPLLWGYGFVAIKRVLATLFANH